MGIARPRNSDKFIKAGCVKCRIETDETRGWWIGTSAYNPDIHHRRSIRLKGYNYSQDGAYAVTLCTQNRECLFGEIEDNKIVYYPCGDMIIKWINEINNKFKHVKIPSYIVMPNHVHAIIVKKSTAVGADLCVCPPPKREMTANLCVDPGKHTGNMQEGEHIGSPLHRIVQWFKTMTTNEYLRGIKTLGWKPFDKRLWQRNYYEQIIRNDADYFLVTEYIKNNPKTWKNDKLWSK